MSEIVFFKSASFASLTDIVRRAVFAKPQIGIENHSGIPFNKSTTSNERALSNFYDDTLLD